MQEIYDKVVDVVRAILRFRWVVLLVAFVIATLGWASVWQLNDKYSARARILVDSNRVLAPLLKGITIQPDVVQRVNLMSKTLLNRPNLERLARESDLDIRATTPLEKEQLIDNLGRTVRLSGSRGNSSLYTVTFTDESPAVARRVVQTLINIFVEGSLGENRQDSSSAQAFLDQQILDYEERLLAAERRLSDFKRENAGKMPGEAGGYYQRLETANIRERNTRLQLREAEQRVASLNRQLRNERPTIAETGPGGLSPIDTAIAARRDELAALLVRYTERHPQVSQLRDTIESLEARKAAVGDDPSNAPRYSLVPNPVYEELRSLLAEAEATVSQLEVRVEDFAGQTAELNATVETIPRIEENLQKLDRDYAVIKGQYEELLERRESARLSEQVEQNVDDVKFRVIDPPFVPSRPTSPDKPFLSLAVAAVAVGAGGALAFALSMFRPVFYEASAVGARTGRPVIGTVSRQPGLKSRWPKILDWSAFVALILLLGATFVVVMALHLGIVDRAQLAPVLNPLSPVIDLISNAGKTLVEQAKTRLGVGG